MRKLYLSVISLFIVSLSQAQIFYTFQASTGTYTTIAGTSPTLTDAGWGAVADEGYANAIPIGFSFSFNGVSYNAANINTNGFITLGDPFIAGSGTSDYFFNSLKSGSAFNPTINPIIAPLWDDLDARNASNIKYSTTGASPNRIFTVQWTGVKWDYNGTANAMSFQVKLYETTNIIKFIYTPGAGTISNASGGASIGIAGIGGGAGNFMSVQNTTTTATVSKVVEVDNILTKPVAGTTFTFTPSAPLTNDAAVSIVYTNGKVAVSRDADFVYAMVVNFGASAITNLPVTLTVSGANSFTNTQIIPNLDPGESVEVDFDTYTPTVVGTNNITVAVSSDQDNTNNSLSSTEIATANTVGTSSLATTTKGVGNSSPIQFAIRFPNLGTKTIEQLRLYFPTTSTGQPYNVSIYTSNFGQPGGALWTSSQTTGGANVDIPVSPSVDVTDDYFIVIEQTGSTNMGYGYETESPLRPGIFFANLGGWVDISDGNSFKLMADVQYAAALPVTLTTFTGERKESRNILSWTTESESKNSGFELQRSADGKEFQKITFVASKAFNGTSNSTLNYSFADNYAFKGDNYYRLKQIDKDGRSTLSKVVLIKGDKVTGLQVTALYPNPSVNSINVVIAADRADLVTLVISDISGKVVAEQHLTVNAGNNTINLPINHLAAGNYVLKATDNTGSISTVTKFVKN